jgi:HEAT repeat protein
MVRRCEGVTVRRSGLVALGLLLAAGAAVAQTPTPSAQTPTVVNGTLETRALTGSLDREMDAIVARTTDPMWVGYAVATTSRGDDDGSCWTSGDGIRARRVGPVQLEGPDALYVLYRLADRKVERIRFASAACPLDAGGLTVRWFTGVSATASLDWLTRFTTGDSVRRLQNQAIVAIALHADPAALDRLLAFARDGKDARLRGDALFWVAQRAGAKAMETITGAIDKDPDTEVKKKAVFALSQMPKDEGVPKLIDVARNNRNVEVRRQAMFWLGQSGDPRALKFFEEVLRK